VLLFKDLEKNIVTTVNYSSNQQIIVYNFDADNGGKMELCDDRTLSLCFSKISTKKLLLFVEVTIQLLSSSVVAEVVSNMVMDSTTLVSAAVDASNELAVRHVVNWDSLEILSIAEDQKGAAVAVMDKDIMYEFLDLR
jgi:hypothetical protein